MSHAGSPRDKPLDVGSGRVAASFDLATAAWLSVGTPHATHGFVQLSAVPPFDEGSRGDADATRRHRVGMTDGAHAFLRVEIDGSPPALRADPSDPYRPRWRGERTEVRAEAPDGGAAVIQTWSIRHRGVPVRIVLRLCGAIDRPALAEITELDAPAPTGATTRFPLGAGPGQVTIVADALPSSVTLEVRGLDVRWEPVPDGLIGAATVEDPRATDFAIHLSFGLARGTELRRPTRALDALTGRALAYVRGCTALATSTGERVILTDHRILPLSWTRDAYWQALALLAADEDGDRERVADHVRWLWRRCERPDGRWARSHHANGRRKDLALQIDQQLYPIIELADYWRLTGALPDEVEWERELPRAWRAALEARDPGTGLLATQENAADDPVGAPYVAASQILTWYAAQRLAELVAAEGLGLGVEEARDVADTTRAAFSSRFAAGSHDPWPYAVDGDGVRMAYHDANDLPTALAPTWGFCAPGDAGWQATVAFAFSPANPAFVPGPGGGLGSAHTPGAWTLGDVQAWIVGRSVGDGAGMATALERLRTVAFVDGMLPEAYRDDARVRHWFAWPGAALAALRLLDEGGRLHDRLAAVRSPTIGR